MGLSLGKQLRYSLWTIPLVLSALLALLNVQALLSWGSSFYAAGTVYYSLILNALCPLGYAFAWLTSKSRQDRYAFLVALTIHLLLLSVAILGNVMHVNGTPVFVMAWILQAEAIGALVLALMRRKAVVVRAILWHEPEQREVRKRNREMRAEEREARQEERRETRLRQEEALIESERQKLVGQAGRRRGGRRVSPGTSTRTLDVDTQDSASQAAPGSALAAALGASPAPAATSVQTEETLLDAGAHQTPSVEAGHHSGVGVETAQTMASTSATTAPTAHVQDNSSSMVDVNTCTPTELLALSGMTAAMARSIVNEREAHGTYRSVEDVVARNDLKPHVVAPFIARLNVGETPVQPKQEGRRGRVLDL